MREEIKEKTEEKRKWKTYNKVVFGLCNIIGTVIAIYVGGWLMFAKSILGTVSAFSAGTLTMMHLAKAVLKCALSATAAGAIWCGGYIAGRKLEK